MEAGWQRDFQALVRNKPKEAVKELEKYRDINRNMFATYKVVRQELENVLDAYAKLQHERLKEAGKGKEPLYPDPPFPNFYPVIPEDKWEEAAAAMYPGSYHPYQGVQNQEVSGDTWASWPQSEEPIENSTGWRYDYWPGTADHPTPVYSDDTDRYTEVVEESQGENSDIPLEELSLTYTSDSEYKPSGKVVIPKEVRRTPRKHGWFSGMFRETRAD
jgi:hypothetical protein